MEKLFLLYFLTSIDQNVNFDTVIFNQLDTWKKQH